MNAATAPKTNVKTFQDMLETAELLGSEAGKGKDTQIKFYLSVVEGGYHSVLDLSANKHGTGVDDAAKLASAYVKAQQGSVVFDAKAANQRKLISCVRTSIKLGGWPKGGNGEPLATVNNLMTMRQKLRQNPAEAKKLDDAANTLLKYARAQLKSDTLLDDSQLREFCYKPGQDLPTAEDIIEAMAKQMDKLIDGSAAKNTAQDASAEIRNARQLLRQRLSAIATQRGHQGNGATAPRRGATNRATAP